MNITNIVHSVDSQDTLGHVEACYIFGEHIVFHQHRHQITTWEELHDEVQVQRVLERIEQLNNP